MKVRKAITILEKQKSKIEDTNHYNDDNWVFQTAAYIKDFFGEKSPQFSFIKQFHFYVMSASWESEKGINQRLSEKPDDAKKFLDNCIETLQLKGIYKEPGKNFLYRISDTALWAIIGLAIPGFISIGVFFGNMHADTQNIELRQKNELLKDSLTQIKSNLYDSIQIH